jgi:hypothetical protein
MKRQIMEKLMKIFTNSNFERNCPSGLFSIVQTSIFHIKRLSGRNSPSGLFFFEKMALESII